MADGTAGALARARAPGAQVGRPRRAVVAQNSSYSRLVGWLKLVLPLVAATLLLLVGAWPQLKASFDHLHLMLPKIDLKEARDLRMLNARYSGLDRQNRPYVVTAEVARQASGQDDLMSLEEPKADITMQSGAWIALTSETGVYQSQAQSLDLFGDVNLYHDRGMTFVTDTAHLDLAAGTAEGHDTVNGHGPSGEVVAEGFQILDKGDVIIFTGKARMVLNSAKDTETAE
jgi:lipopolysaccharide export system protein LptC